MTKPMSAAEYRANAEKKRAQRPTEIVALSSGSVFELRRPDLSAYMITGRLPQSLVREGLKAWKKGQGAETLSAQLEDQDLIDSLVFMREVVHECTVNPKFVEFATSDNEIGAADMLPEDFNEIFRWAMNYEGVAGIDGLRTFRGGRKRGVTGNRSERKKRGDTPEQVPELEEAIQ